MELWYFLQAHPLMAASWLGLIGLLLGSFFNVVILRWPERLAHSWRQEARQVLELPEEIGDTAPMDLVVSHSRCPHCQHALSWWENIPLLSFLLLRGRCRSCKAPISWQYPIVETLGAVVAFGAVLGLGLTGHTLLVVGALWVLLILSFIDGRTYLLPDSLVYVLLWTGLGTSALGVTGVVPLPQAVLGAVAGYLLLWSVYWLFKLIRGKEGMGYGDFKLLAALGAWCGLSGLWSIVVVSTLLGALIGVVLIVAQGKTKAHVIPFGPYLAMAGALELLFPRWLFHVLGMP